MFSATMRDLSNARFTPAPPTPTYFEAWVLAQGMPDLAVSRGAGHHIANENEQRWPLHAACAR